MFDEDETRCDGLSKTVRRPEKSRDGRASTWRMTGCEEDRWVVMVRENSKGKFKGGCHVKLANYVWLKTEM